MPSCVFTMSTSVAFNDSQDSKICIQNGWIWMGFEAFIPFFELSTQNWSCAPLHRLGPIPSWIPKYTVYSIPKPLQALRWISGGSVPTASSVMVCSTWIRGFTSHRNRSKTCYREANFFANCYANWSKLCQIVNTFGSKSMLRPRNMMGFATDAVLCRDAFFQTETCFHMPRHD